MAALGDESNGSTVSIALNGHRFDMEANELLDAAGEHVPLRPQCLALLRCLARRAGRVVAREDLMREVWPNLVVTDDSLVQCVRALRDALGDAEHRVLQTEPRRGYRLVPLRVTARDAKPEADPAQEVRYATSSDGVRIAYVCCGQGVPVVRAAGGISHLDYDMDCLTEGPILRAVARGHRLIRYDRRGQGLSDRRATALSLDQAVRDLEAVVDAEGLSRFVLWAIGAGASPIRFTAQHPERVERLILTGAQVRGFGDRKDGVWGDTSPSADLIIEAFWQDQNSLIRTGGGPDALSRTYPTATLEQVRSYDRMLMLSCSGAAAVELWRAGLHWDATADLDRVRCPTLVVHSQRNRAILLEQAELIAARIPGARLVTLDTDNILPLPQEPAFDELVRLIDAFIAEGAAAWPASVTGASPGATVPHPS